MMVLGAVLYCIVLYCTLPNGIEILELKESIRSKQALVPNINRHGNAAMIEQSPLQAVGGTPRVYHGFVPCISLRCSRSPF